MDYLGRESSPFNEGFWNEIDKTVVAAARKRLVGRKFLSIYGSLGAGALSVQYDKAGREEVAEDGIVKTSGRRSVEIPQIYEDFNLLWRDIEHNEKSGMPLDMSVVSLAAHNIANKEDKIIFHGNKFINAEGLTNTEGVQKLKISDWKSGENPFLDIVKCINMIREKGVIGKYVLCVSQSLFFDLQRIQPGTGMTEGERLSKMISSLHIVSSLKEKQALLLCPESQYMDLVIGTDIATAYLEQKDLNHSFRIMETVLPRIKEPNAIVVME